MHRSFPTFATSSLAALAACAALFVSSTAGASPEAHKGSRVARVAPVVKNRPCEKPAVSVAAGAEAAMLSLTKCDGSMNQAGVDELSILARPGSAPKPVETIAALSKVHGADLAPGIRRINARLAEELQLAVDHFRKEGETTHVVLVSGFRPRSTGSYHASGRALDFRIEGVSNSDLVAFCKTLPDTGCGAYPNSVFVHMDVRPPGTGHVAWVDLSHPGESPRYVSPAVANAEAKNDKAGASPATNADPSSGKSEKPEAVAGKGERAEAVAVKGDKPEPDAVTPASEKLPPLPKAESKHHSFAASIVAPGSL
jgi:hypothetical protein